MVETPVTNLWQSFVQFYLLRPLDEEELLPDDEDEDLEPELEDRLLPLDRKPELELRPDDPE